MEKIKFNYFGNVKKQNPETNSGELLVEDAGSMSAEQRVELMISAGRRLQISKKNYDFAPGEDVDETVMMDPTRGPNFDLADGSQMLRNVEQKIIEAKQKKQLEEKEAREKKETDAAKDLKDPEGAGKSDPGRGPVG